ncbi:unnamed protein product [Phytophthora fragariaefolia]|uniref:Unnamed protein product n=1 Tax=Phytophthora fragariaefolia TaxID=1490495 RepID=A0A9W6XU66_9STRA|nr:unnamed protein product [Phytophthora fragariaefolia]
MEEELLAVIDMTDANQDESDATGSAASRDSDNNVEPAFDISEDELRGLTATGWKIYDVGQCGKSEFYRIVLIPFSCSVNDVGKLN